MFSTVGKRIFSGQLLLARNAGRRAGFRYQSTQAPPPKAKPSGLKGLMQEYGYSALGVYLAIGCIDLPLCYALVTFVGEERIGEYEDKVKSYLGFGKANQDDDDFKGQASESQHHTSFWTKFALAYGLHKSLIFIRLPIAAAITPTVVAKMRSLGFNIGNKQFKTIATNASESYKEHGLRKSATSKGVKTILENSKMQDSDVKLAIPPPNSATPKSFGTPPTRAKKWFSWFF